MDAAGVRHPVYCPRRCRTLRVTVLTRIRRPVDSCAEDSTSGLCRTLGKRVGCHSPQGFKSPILRAETPEARATGRLAMSAYLCHVRERQR